MRERGIEPVAAGGVSAQSVEPASCRAGSGLAPWRGCVLPVSRSARRGTRTCVASSPTAHSASSNVRRTSSSLRPNCRADSNTVFRGVAVVELESIRSMKAPLPTTRRAITRRRSPFSSAFSQGLLIFCCEIRSVRVLIVEDDKRMAAAVRRGLQAEGIVADLASNGEDALWMAAATEFDAVVLDVMLPGHRRLRRPAAACARTACGPRSSW